MRRDGLYVYDLLLAIRLFFDAFWELQDKKAKAKAKKWGFKLNQLVRNKI